MSKKNVKIKVKYPKCLTLLPCYDWSKKKDISTLPDWIYLLFLVHMHSNLIVNSAVNLNSPLKHPSTNLCLRKLGYLTDDALNCPVTFMLWISLIWVNFSFFVLLPLQFPPLIFPSYWLLYSLYPSALQTSEQMHNTECATNWISKLIDCFHVCSNTKKRNYWLLR